ncbi:MAG: 2-oxoglutarate and iron-dependent oxygenase domain-containing protein, partial [Verrucomicrobiota bacterium]|nr:2-oxoglutarate and iron-dependent oxygenase domain-containing protein [Verrucomicrobiota bacterium]
MTEGLPTFNYQDVISHDPSLLEALRATCHLTGFFYLRHPQLASGPLARMFHYTREYFALPMAEKKAMH